MSETCYMFTQDTKRGQLVSVTGHMFTQDTGGQRVSVTCHMLTQHMDQTDFTYYLHRRYIGLHTIVVKRLVIIKITLKPVFTQAVL